MPKMKSGMGGIESLNIRAKKNEPLRAAEINLVGPDDTTGLARTLNVNPAALPSLDPANVISSLSGGAPAAPNVDATTIVTAAEKRAETTAATENADKLQKEHAEMAADLTQAEANLETAEKQLEAVRNDLALEKSERTQQVAQLTQTIYTLKNERDDVRRNASSEADGVRAELTRTRANLERKLGAAVVTSTSLSDQLTEAQKQLGVAQGTAQNERLRANKGEQTITSISEQLAEKSVEIERLRADIRSAHEALQSMQERVTATSQELANGTQTQALLAVTQDELTDALTRIDDLEREDGNRSSTEDHLRRELGEKTRIATEAEAERAAVESLAALRDEQLARVRDVSLAILRLSPYVFGTIGGVTATTQQEALALQSKLNAGLTKLGSDPTALDTLTDLFAQTDQLLQTLPRHELEQDANPKTTEADADKNTDSADLQATDPVQTDPSTTSVTTS